MLRSFLAIEKATIMIVAEMINMTKTIKKTFILFIFYLSVDFVSRAA